MTPPSPRDLVKTAAERHGDRVAVISGDERITYGQLADRTAALAAALKESGVGPGVQVALALPNSATFFVCYFGVLEAGGIVAPVSATATAAEVDELLTASQAQFLIAPRDSALPASLGTAPEPSPLPSGDAVIWRMKSGGPSLDTIPWREDGYFLRQFSSGSTGRPKHMLKTEANLSCESEFMRQTYDLGSDEVFMIIATFHHAFGQAALHLGFHVGATVSIVPRFIPGAVIDAARRDRPTMLFATPPVFDVLGSCLLRPDDRSVFRTLKLCLCGTGRLSRASHDEFLERFGISISARSGSSEAHSVTFDSDEGFEEGRVGRPYPGVEIVVLDDDGDPCPAGTAGQIGVRSPAASSRYEGDPEMTAQTFRDGWVFLGDVGYFDDQGRLHLIGRSDIINIGGYKVDKLEVERVIRDSLPVADVVVMEATSAGLAVIRAVIEADPDRVTKTMVVEVCRESLSSYKVPRVVEIRRTFERDANGKVLMAKIGD